MEKRHLAQAPAKNGAIRISLDAALQFALLGICAKAIAPRIIQTPAPGNGATPSADAMRTISPVRIIGRTGGVSGAIRQACPLDEKAEPSPEKKTKNGFAPATAATKSPDGPAPIRGPARVKTAIMGAGPIERRTL